MAKKEEKSSSKPRKRMSAREREEVLIENFVGLQKAMTNLSVRFGVLSENISKLLQIFEDAAKSFANTEGGMDKNIMSKMNALLDQNKTIAKGLVLLEDKLNKNTGQQPSMPPQNPQMPQSNQQKPNEPTNPTEGYLPSVSDKQEGYKVKPKPLPSI